jgi:Arc/MetJ-type ribon-helix-helix transcriptional regulator
MMLRMEVTLKQDLEARVREKLRNGQFESAEDLVEQAIAFFLDYEEGEMDPAEFREAKIAVDEALAQAGSGEGLPIEEFDRAMRTKHGIPR